MPYLGEKNLELFSFFQVRIKIHKEDQNGKYQQIFKHIPEFDWCKVLKSASKNSPNIFAKICVLVMRRFVPLLASQCPFPVMEVELHNKTVPFQYLTLVPPGTYRIEIVWMYKNHDVMLNLTVVGKLFDSSYSN